MQKTSKFSMTLSTPSPTIANRTLDGDDIENIPDADSTAFMWLPVLNLFMKDKDIPICTDLDHFCFPC